MTDEENYACPFEPECTRGGQSHKVLFFSFLFFLFFFFVPLPFSHSLAMNDLANSKSKKDRQAQIPSRKLAPKKIRAVYGNKKNKSSPIGRMVCQQGE